MASAQRDPYSVLGVRRDADAKAVKSAYHRLAQEHHPDLNQDDSVAEERFKQVLLEKGLLTEIKDISDLPADDWKPIKAKGKPVSEIVIEERR